VIIGSAVVLLAAGLLGAGWWLSYRPDLARVLTSGDQVVVRPIGVARLLAFRREFRLDRPAIQHVAAIGRDGLPHFGVRLLGTGMPGLLAGMFTSTRDGRCFALVGRGDRFLRIDTGSGTVRCTVLQVRDPDLLAATLHSDS
jgi:hypothetical protein